jgi:hypothetical protein
MFSPIGIDRELRSQQPPHLLAIAKSEGHLLLLHMRSGNRTAERAPADEVRQQELCQSCR